MTQHEENQPELDLDLLGDWCAFCDGSRDFDRYHFSTILMGVFLGGLTPEVDSFLKRFAEPFAPPLYDNLIRIAEDRLLDQDVLPWVRRDLNEKLKLLEAYAESEMEAQALIRLIRTGNYSLTHHHDEFIEIKGGSENHQMIYDMVGDSVIDSYPDRRFFALSEALYHLATSVEVQQSIMAPLLSIPADLKYYFEIYLRGGDYAVTDNDILVYRDALNPSNGRHIDGP
jgi:hypothetical protein